MEHKLHGVFHLMKVILDLNTFLKNDNFWNLFLRFFLFFTLKYTQSFNKTHCPRASSYFWPSNNSCEVQRALCNCDDLLFLLIWKGLASDLSVGGPQGNGKPGLQNCLHRVPHCWRRALIFVLSEKTPSSPPQLKLCQEPPMCCTAPLLSSLGTGRSSLSQQGHGAGNSTPAVHLPKMERKREGN